jgi:hypothetical protein
MFLTAVLNAHTDRSKELPHLFREQPPRSGVNNQDAAGDAVQSSESDSSDAPEEPEPVLPEPARNRWV